MIMKTETAHSAIVPATNGASNSTVAVSTARIATRATRVSRVSRPVKRNPGWLS